MSRSGISPVTIGVLLITIYDSTGQSFIIFSNVAILKTLWLVSASSQTPTPAAIASSVVFTPLNHLSAK